MNSFFKLLLGVMAAALVLGRSSVALANGGDWHLGGVATGISVFVVWIGGGLIVIFLLTGFLLWVWASRFLKRKEEQERRLQSAGANTMTSESDDIRQEG